SPDGTVLAVGSSDGSVRIQDLATGGWRPALGIHLAGVSSVAFSPDGKTLATGGQDRAIRLWQGGTRHRVVGPSGQTARGDLRGLHPRRHRAGRGAARRGRPRLARGNVEKNRRALSAIPDGGRFPWGENA